ncbi:MAG: LbtU family siderophore porin [Deltaproteobacteria bacterium]|nr:LbtU family siderophore porin [Candidatus Anaeroferrophillacea bacterium]
MKKICTLFAVVLVVLLVCAFAGPAAASGDADLQRKIDLLERQLNDLQRQLTSQRQDIEENRKKTESIGDAAGAFEKIAEHVTISGLIEVEAGFTEDYDGNDESDIVLATVELGIDVDLHTYVSGHILLLWEEDDTEPVDLDEGYITIGNTEFFPVYLQAGKMYVPFGNFESHMISDPLTLELGETRESAALLGLEYAGFYAGAYAFNGDIDEIGDDNEIECFGLNAGYAFENEQFSFDIGGGWISSIGDSDALGDALPGEINDHVDGLAAHAIISWSGLTLIGEYVGANDDFEAGELDFRGQGAEPETWNIELGYTFAVGEREAFVAAAWQGSDEALALELPEDRWLAAAGIGIFEGLSLAVEYAHDEDYDESDGGTGDEADTVTVQLALEF